MALALGSGPLPRAGVDPATSLCGPCGRVVRLQPAVARLLVLSEELQAMTAEVVLTFVNSIFLAGIIFELVQIRRLLAKTD